LTEKEKEAARAKKITAGLRVRLASQGVTGVVYLEADYLDPKEYSAMTVPWKPRFHYLPSAPSTTTVLGAALHKIARDLEKTDIHKITSDLDTLVLNATKLVQEINLQQLSSQAGRTPADLQEAAQEARGLMKGPEFRRVISDAASAVDATRGLIADLSQASKQIKSGSEKFQDAFSGFERAAQRVDRLLSNKSQDLVEAVENLRVVSENLRELTNNAKRYPAQLLWGEPPPRTGATKR
ncbi:MAG: hypothetical protein C4293_20910, partial [Nitrospiraceae bacterium]